MGYIKIFEMDENGAGFINLDEANLSEKVEIELALTTPNAIQTACVICFTPLNGGNTCDTHKGMKPTW